MKLLTALLTVVLATTAHSTAMATQLTKTKSAQCMIGQTFFDCTKKTEIMGVNAVIEINFANNESWVVNRTWNDESSRAMLKSSKKQFKVETYWRDEDFFDIVPFGDATEYDWECFKVKGSTQDFCWKENYS